MQGKGLIKFFLVALILVTLYQFFLMLPTRSVEKKAREYAAQRTGDANPDSGDFRVQEGKYLDSMANESVLNLGFYNFTYQDLKKRQLQLGLDLKGGMSVTMQVSLRELISKLSGESNDKDFLKAIQLARERESNAQSDFVTLFANAWSEVANGKKLASIFSLNSSLQDQINYSTSDADVIKIIREEADITVDRTYNLIQQRIDRYGVTQPNVTLDKSTNRIFVELPGVTNPKTAKDYLVSTAELEFWEMYTGPEIAPSLNRLDLALKAKEGTNTFVDIDSSQMVFDTLGLRIDSVYMANKEKIDNQGLESSSAGPLMSLLSAKTGDFFQGGAGVCGGANTKDTAAINKLLNSKTAKGLLPRDAQFMWGSKTTKDDDNKFTNVIELYTVKVPKTSKAMLEGDVITRARSDIDPTRGINVVTLRMNDTGSKIWRKMTKNNVNRPVGISLDKKVVSAPNVVGEIGGGNTEISGSFTSQEATNLANILEIGKLPAKPEIISSDVVGPTLGKKNVTRGITSLVVGVCLVLMFMILYYGSGGIVSILALFANLFFIIGALASWGTVLTFPGIAGIVLTIGMAVDANVIIFERIREELRDGKAMGAAIRDGFGHSYSAIVDANVTTILTAFVLAYFGQGPIKGFAVVLIIGVVCSLFTAVLCSRLMIDWWTEKGKEVNFFTKIFKDPFANLNIDFVGKGKTMMTISGVIILAGLISFFTLGFELGVDLKGGRTYTIAFPQAVDNIDNLRTELTKSLGGEMPVVKNFGGNNQVQVTTSYKISERSETIDEEITSLVYNGVNAYTGGKINDIEAFNDTYLQSSVKVGPTIADDIRQSAFYATIVALIFIFVYILIRFRKWQYGMGAIAALFHDVLIILTLFSLFHKFLPFSLEINQAFIAAILTVVGYSINDTVVVFDRIREFFNTYSTGTKSKNEIVNMAVNATISRTIITSLTTAFVVLMLFIFGGEVIRGFAFALLAGVIVGTYSSVFIATPVVVFLTKETELKQTGGAKTSTEKKGYVKKSEQSV